MWVFVLFALQAPGAKPVVKCLLEDKETLEFVEDHFTVPVSHSAYILDEILYLWHLYFERSTLHYLFFFLFQTNHQDCRTDQLQRPKHFPEPVMQYTLKEMTLIWHLYGGRDFGPAKDHSSPSSASSSPASSPYNTKRQFRDATHTSGAATTVRARTNGGLGGFGKGRGLREKTGGKKGDAKRGGPSDWKTAGGPGRDHSVLVELELDKVHVKWDGYLCVFC